MPLLLGIEGLPSAYAELVPGRLYVVVLEDQSLALSLAWLALLAALSDNRPAALVVEEGLERSVMGAGLLAATARQALCSGLITVFQGNGGDSPRSVKDATGRMLEELQYFKLVNNSLLVVDGADRFLNLEPDDSHNGDNVMGKPSLSSQLLRWHQWALDSGNTALLLCRRREVQSNPAESLQHVADSCAGFARLRRVDGAINWEVFHWFTNIGMSAGKQFLLNLNHEGHLVAVESGEVRAGLEPAVDENVVLAMKSAWPGNQPLPANWLLLDHLEALKQRIAQTIAATIIVNFDQNTKLETLTKSVFLWRQLRGNRLKIVVREVNVRLRYNQEALLTQLGANLVVPAEVSHSRFLSLLSMIQGQLFQRTLPANYEDAVKAAMPVMGQGYLPPSGFVDAVETALESSRGLGIDNAMVRLPLVFGLRPLDALRYCVMKRPGDVCSSDHQHIYLFLFACRENDVSMTLERLFQLPVSELFNGENRYLSQVTIRATIEDFETRMDSAAADSNASFPDLSAALQGLSSVNLPGKADASSKNEAPIQRKAPAPAVPRPLPLRPSALSPSSISSPH